MTTATPDARTDPPHQFCSLCGRPMDPDQEWCLECGAARTVITRAPDWRVPVLVVGTVILVIAALFIVLITQVGHNAGKLTVVKTVTASRAPTVSSWQPGLDGYTVVLASARTESAADQQAAQLLAGGLTGLGVLSTRQHPQMKPQGVWDVFSGRYPSYALAHAAAVKAAKHGHTGATPALVQRPGQG